MNEFHCTQIWKEKHSHNGIIQRIHILESYVNENFKFIVSYYIIN